MKYIYREIGDRIKTERKKRYTSQDNFIVALKEKGAPIGRNTLSKIENYEIDDIKLSVLLAMCELFECDMSYLLGDSPYSTKEKRTAGRLLGLSPQALDGLITLGIRSKCGIMHLLEKHSEELENLLYVLSLLIPMYGNSLLIYSNENGKKELTIKPQRYTEYIAGIKELETTVREIIETKINYNDYLGLDIPPELLPKKQ